MTFADYLKRHYNKKDGLRLGQRFFVDFIKSDKELDDLNLFYERDDQKSIWIIEEWLYKHHYTYSSNNHLPEKLKRI